MLRNTYDENYYDNYDENYVLYVEPDERLCKTDTYKITGWILFKPEDWYKVEHYTDKKGCCFKVRADC